LKNSHGGIIKEFSIHLSSIKMLGEGRIQDTGYRIKDTGDFPEF
jgi:hypothetical protein